MWRIDSSELPQKGTLTPDRLYLDVTTGKKRQVSITASTYISNSVRDLICGKTVRLLHAVDKMINMVSFGFHF